MKRVATALRMSPRLGFGYGHARVLLGKKKKNEKKKKNIAHNREETHLYSKFFNDSIQVARQTRIQIIIYLFVNVFLFLYLKN